MYGLILKYKSAAINLVILAGLIFSFIDKNSFLKDFFLGATSALVLIKLGEGIGKLKREKSENEIKNISNKKE